MSVSNQSVVRCKPNYNFCLKSGEEPDFIDSSDDSLDYKPTPNVFTTLKQFPIVSTKNRGQSSGQSLIEAQNKTKKNGLQGRKPQVGSPLITEEFKFGDRYQCKVCLRSYLWKKSLVRHYKDLHPNCVQLVTE